MVARKINERDRALRRTTTSKGRTDHQHQLTRYMSQHGSISLLDGKSEPAAMVANNASHEAGRRDGDRGRHHSLDQHSHRTRYLRRNACGHHQLLEAAVHCSIEVLSNEGVSRYIPRDLLGSRERDLIGESSQPYRKNIKRKQTDSPKQSNSMRDSRD
jgi:hypothetical protein